jgi:hypothetical protein
MLCVMEAFMRGQSLSVKTSELSYIFFKIREARAANVRRSWLRRARIALESRTDLTPAERHEIICVRSQSNVSRIASPALEKFNGNVASAQFCEWQKQPARQYMRAGFDQHGQPTRKKAAKACTLAANDECFECEPKPESTSADASYKPSAGALFSSLFYAVPQTTTACYWGDLRPLRIVGLRGQPHSLHIYPSPSQSLDMHKPF